MMGAGKSSVGRELAERTGRVFLDTDQLLQHRLGRPIAQLFQIYGEESFRAHETAVLRSLEPGFTILATGGGIVMRPENWQEFARLGATIYLEASPETLIARLDQSKKKRPLLMREDWQETVRTLLESRIPMYRQAEVTVGLDGADISEAAERVLTAMREAGR